MVFSILVYQLGDILVPLLGNSKIWGKGYTTIPYTIRKLLELENGSEIKWIFEKGKVHILKEKNK